MPCVRCSKTLRAPLEPGLLCLLQAPRLRGPAAMQRVKLLKASAKGSPGSLFGSPQHSASEVDGVVFDGLELGPELQFLFTSGAAPSPSNSGSDSQGHSKVRRDGGRCARWRGARARA